MEMDVIVHEQLSQVGAETLAHQISEQLYCLQSVEMAQLIQMRCVMMETLITTMAVTLHEILNQDTHAQIQI